MSKPARFTMAAIILATLGLEVWAYLAFRDTVDGQPVLLNVALAVYAFIAVGAVYGLDAVVRWLLRRRRSAARP
jgi:hypothetical protein